MKIYTKKELRDIIITLTIFGIVLMTASKHQERQSQQTLNDQIVPEKVIAAKQSGYNLN